MKHFKGARFSRIYQEMKSVLCFVSIFNLDMKISQGFLLMSNVTRLDYFLEWRL